MSRSVLFALIVALAMGGWAFRLTWTPDAMPVNRRGPSQLSLVEVSAERPLALRTPDLRVRIAGSDSSPKLSIRVAGPYRVTTVGGWYVLAQDSRLDDVEIAANGTGLNIGPRAFDGDRLHLEVIHPGTLWVDGRNYPGHLQLIRHGEDHWSVVNVVPLEDYVAEALPHALMPDHVLSSETSPPVPDEALAALAIVIRSEAMYRMKTAGAASDWDIDARHDERLYTGTATAAATAERPAVRQPSRLRTTAGKTRGVVVAFHGRLICTYHTAACGGHTFAGNDVFAAAAPPVIGRDCSACADDPTLRWQRRVACDELRKNLQRYLKSRPQTLGQLRRIEVFQADDAGMPKVRILGSRSEIQLTAEQFRSQVAGDEILPSNRYTLQQDGNSLRQDGAELLFEGVGQGHGVGLCRHGAIARARQGQRCSEIIEYYYPGTELIRVQ